MIAISEKVLQEQLQAVLANLERNEVERKALKHAARSIESLLNVQAGKPPRGAMSGRNNKPVGAISVYRAVCDVLREDGGELQAAEIARRAIARGAVVTNVGANLGYLMNRGYVERVGPGRYRAVPVEELGQR